MKEKRTLAVRILFSVPGPGIEPGWVAPPVFETGASTDSAIRANGGTKLSVFFVFYNSILRLLIVLMNERQRRERLKCVKWHIVHRFFAKFVKY